MQQRLAAAGVRAINNIVDITNYVLLELGHPMHAFDFERLGGPELRIRTARTGERVTTLDGQDRALDARHARHRRRDAAAGDRRRDGRRATARCPTPPA